MTMACGRRRTFSHTRPTTAEHADHARHEFSQSRSGSGRTRVSRKSRTSTRKKGRGKQNPSLRLRQDLTKRSAKSPRSVLGSSCKEKKGEGGANKEVNNRRSVQLCLEETHPSIRETSVTLPLPFPHPSLYLFVYPPRPVTHIGLSK